MQFRSFFYLQLIVASNANTVHLIRDYFFFKDVSRLVGFSCFNVDEYEITRIFNDAGIAVSIKQLQPNIDIPRFLHTDYWTLGVFLDLRCNFTDENIKKLFRGIIRIPSLYWNHLFYYIKRNDEARIMIQASENYMFEHLHQWLILSENINRTVQLFNETTFSIVMDVIISVSENENYVLYDVYNHCKHCGGLLNITTFGSWSLENGLEINLIDNKFKRRWNYFGMNVKVIGVVSVTNRSKDQDLIEYLQEKKGNLLDNWSKFGYSLIVHIAEMFNFTLEVSAIDHWEKGNKIGPLVTSLNKRLYDLGYYPSILTLERMNNADVITQVWPLSYNIFYRTCFMFLTVPSSKMDINIIFRPFSTNVWYMILLLSFIIIFALWLILKVENNSDYGATVLIIVAALCQQGLPFNDSSKYAGRVAFLHTLIFGLLLYNYYSAAVVSARLNAPLNKMNDSLYSLMHSKMKLTAYKDIYFNYLFRAPVTEVQLFKKYWDKIPENEKFESIEKGVREIMKPGHAYHIDPVLAYPLIEVMFTKQMICQLTEVHLFRPSTIGLWSSQHGQFLEITKIGLIRMYTAGIRKRQVLRWTAKRPYCDKEKPYVSSVTIHETIPILLILLFGITLSIIICFIENITFRTLQTKQWKRKSEQVRRKSMTLKNKIVLRKSSDKKNY
nr:PREDICTED: LOW QUALITY PROTEIN: uncharacterized protein LOC100877692 [Megachile rotundata]